MEQQILNELEMPDSKPVPIISRQDELAKIVQQVEEEAAKTALKLPARRHFNQPNLLAVSSLNSVSEPQNASPYSGVGFSKFQVNLPLPLLDVESLQLLNANIPQASQNISDTALVFWYYRLAEIQGTTPTVDNLYCVRLLPSYYRQEFINNATNYGFNRTFKKYSDLATELAKSCLNDIAWTNSLLDPTNALNYTFPFCPGDISITYNSTLNKFQTAGNYALLPPAYRRWNSSTAYVVGDQVVADAALSIEATYICIQNIAPGVTPPLNLPAYWKRNNQPFVLLWNSGTSYIAGQYVSYLNVLYKSILSSTNITPLGNTTYWTAVDLSVTDFVWNYYLLAGPSDPNVIAKQNSLISGGDQIGMYEISKEWDFQEVGLAYSFPVGIPPQPFNPAPKRLLNTVLGFTWNGIFNPQNLSLISGNTFNQVPSQLTELYNRLRPVPFYTAVALLSEGYGTTPVESNYYTADGYCNLVFSSVIYIYSTLVLGSSVDTQRTSNLLAVMPIACGNLGITFASNFIDNPMTKVQGDLYTVGIELYNEYAEPYNLTNNAVGTFTFKLTYKSPEKIVQNLL